MKEIVKVDPKEPFPGVLYNMMHISFKAKVINTALRLQIFDRLKKGDTAKAVADALNLHEDKTKIFFDILVALGFLAKDGDNYRNKPQVNMFVTSDSPINHAIGYQRTSEMTGKILDNLDELLKLDGKADQASLLGTQQFEGEEMWGWLARSMEGSGLHQAQLVLPYIKSLPEWPSFKKMMDLGGGPGTVCLSFVAEHKTMKGVVLDQKEVANEARKIISEYGFEDRVTAQAGDYIKDAELGEDFDFVWSSATLNLAKGHLVQVFRKIYNALSPGGVFASYHPAIWGNGQDDWEMVVSFSPYQMLGIDMQLYENEIPDAMIKAGFHTVKSKNVRNFFGNQRLDIAKKPK